MSCRRVSTARQASPASGHVGGGADLFQLWRDASGAEEAADQLPICRTRLSPGHEHWEAGNARHEGRGEIVRS